MIHVLSLSTNVLSLSVSSISAEVFIVKFYIAGLSLLSLSFCSIHEAEKCAKRGLFLLYLNICFNGVNGFLVFYRCPIFSEEFAFCKSTCHSCTHPEKKLSAAGFICY